MVHVYYTMVMLVFQVVFEIMLYLYTRTRSVPWYVHMYVYVDSTVV